MKKSTWAIIIALLVVILVAIMYFGLFSLSIVDLGACNEEPNGGYTFMSPPTSFYTQGFKPTFSELDGVALRLMKSQAITGTFFISIADEKDPEGGGNVLSYEIFSTDLIPFGERVWVEFDFTNTISVTPEAEYWIRIGSLTGNFEWNLEANYLAGGGYYSHGAFDYWSQYGGFTQTNIHLNRDMLFKLYRDEVEVTCWKCEGENPVSQNFPEGTICGESPAEEYPYVAEPDCTNPPECGDGMCDPGEKCENCPEDCGECDPPVTPGFELIIFLVSLTSVIILLKRG